MIKIILKKKNGLPFKIVRKNKIKKKKMYTVRKCVLLFKKTIKLKLGLNYSILNKYYLWIPDGKKKEPMCNTCETKITVERILTEYIQTISFPTTYPTP